MVPVITWHPRSDVPGLRPSANAGLVEIVNPSWPPLGASPKWGAYVTVTCWDVGDPQMTPAQLLVAKLLGSRRNLCLAVGDRLFGGGGWPWRPFLAADASAVVDFRREAEARRLVRIHVSCEYGRSRSRAVAEWLAEEFGTAATGNTTGRPNARVVRLLRV